tara:strand:+ start:1518 stop:2390 length:873 start_codon:yes stop_codon:yes gene_type:complete
MFFKKSFVHEVYQIFTSKKNINLILFNILGLQVFRYLLSKIAFLFAKFIFQDNKLLSSYENKGVYLTEDFLPEKDFLKVQEEFSKIFDDEKKARNTYKDSPDQKNSSIDYYLYEFEDNIFNNHNYPNLCQVLKNKKINDFFKFAEKKKKIHLYMRLERVFTKDQLRNDSNAYWHVDTYHNTHKGWIYLTDVKKENGPYNYIVGSNKFSFERLFWEYSNSIKTCFYKNYLSFFFIAKDSKKFENKKLEVICNKNSFMITNTHGCHRRGDSEVHQVRDAISFYTRENPFKII